MNAPRRIVVVDDDAKVRALLERAFRAPEFETRAFPTGGAALRRIPEIRPDCVVSEALLPDMDGESLLRAVRAMPGLERVPFIAVSAARSEAGLRAILAAGGHSFLLKPFPLRDLLDKVRGALARPPAGAPLDGDESPTRPLVTGPHTTSTAAVRRKPPPAPTPAPDVRQVELGPAEPGQGFGRFTRVQTRDRSLVVLTEATARPRFTITTVITEDGAPLRRIESALPHPLAREEDDDTVRRQVHLQHEDALRRLDELVLDRTPRRVVWPDRSRNVDAGVLAWAMSAVAQMAEAETGTDETARQLRRTLAGTSAQEVALEAFRVTREGRVVVSPAHGERVPRRAVRAVAGWCRAFAAATLRWEGDRLPSPVRHATRRYALELERMGFYDWLSRRAKR
jgi:DNA-binding response OmpR family regulator